MSWILFVLGTHHSPAHHCCPCSHCDHYKQTTEAHSGSSSCSQTLYDCHIDMLVPLQMREITNRNFTFCCSFKIWSFWANKNGVPKYSLHSSSGSSELSPQSSSTSHFQACGMQRPFRHLNCPGRHVLAEQWAGSSSEWSPQSSSPSHCHDSGMHRLFAHCHWWLSHWWVAGNRTATSISNMLVNAGNFKQQIKEVKLTTQHRIFIWTIGTVLVTVTEKVWTGTVSIAALKLPKMTVTNGTGGRFVWAVSAVALTITLPPDGNTTDDTEARCQTIQSHRETNTHTWQFWSIYWGKMSTLIKFWATSKAFPMVF